jgi:hypothetical protein
MLIVSSFCKPYKPSPQRIDSLFNNAARAKIQTLFKPICATDQYSKNLSNGGNSQVLEQENINTFFTIYRIPKNIIHINSYSFLIIHGSFNRQKPSIIPTFTLRNKKCRHIWYPQLACHWRKDLIHYPSKAASFSLPLKLTSQMSPSFLPSFHLNINLRFSRGRNLGCSSQGECTYQSLPLLSSYDRVILRQSAASNTYAPTTHVILLPRLLHY